VCRDGISPDEERLRSTLHEHADRHHDHYHDDYDFDDCSDHFVSPGKPRNELPDIRRPQHRPVHYVRQLLNVVSGWVGLGVDRSRPNMGKGTSQKCRIRNEDEFEEK